VWGWNTIQSRLYAAAPTQTFAGVQALGGAVSPLPGFSPANHVVVARSPGASGTDAEFGQTHAVGLCRQRHQHVAGSNVGQRSSAWRSTPVVASWSGLGHRQPGRHHVDTAVDDDHGGQRNVERTHCGVDLVAKILAWVDCQFIIPASWLPCSENQNPVYDVVLGKTNQTKLYLSSGTLHPLGYLLMTYLGCLPGQEEPNRLHYFIR